MKLKTAAVDHLRSKQFHVFRHHLYVFFGEMSKPYLKKAEITLNYSCITTLPVLLFI